jgi:hypothetical protein
VAVRRRTVGKSKEKKKPKQLTAWSFSRWHTYQRCPRKAKFAYIDKIPDPGGPAMRRGSEIHDVAEAYVKGTIEKTIPDSLELFEREFVKLRATPDVEVEKEWAFTNAWEPTGWFDPPAWCRMKIDVIELTTYRGKKVARIIDHKTGREREHHAKQFELYALGGFLMFDVETIITENWYLDQGEIVDRRFQAKEVHLLIELWNERTSEMLSDRFFPARGSITHDCRWCAYAKSKGGPCSRG